MSNAQLPAPIAGYRFGVEIEGLVVGWFSDCASLSAQRAVLPYEEGGVNAYTAQLPGRVSYSDVTLKDGIAGDVLWDWFHDGQYDAGTERRNVSIVLYDAAGGEAARWDLLDCLPLKWTGPTYTAGAAQVAVQEIRIGRGEGTVAMTSVQRARSDSLEAEREDAPAGGLDLHELALKIYDLLRQDLRLERERSGRRRW